MVERSGSVEVKPAKPSKSMFDTSVKTVKSALSAKCFGLLVWYVIMHRPEKWASGRDEKDGSDIGSRTYFRVDG